MIKDLQYESIENIFTIKMLFLKIAVFSFNLYSYML